jgi:hypothetical protein
MHGLARVSALLSIAAAVNACSLTTNSGSASPSVTIGSATPAATPISTPEVSVQSSASGVPSRTPSATPCVSASAAGTLAFDCFTVTATITAGGAGYSPVSGVHVFFWPEQEQTDCAVNGALAILVAGDPATQAPFNVLAPARQGDPRACNDYGLEVRFDVPVTSMTFEVPNVGDEYGATVWDQNAQHQISIFQGLAQYSSDGLVAFRFTSSTSFYEVFLSRLPDGEPLFVRSVRYQP